MIDARGLDRLEAVLRSASAFDAVQINQPLPSHIDTRAAAAVLRPGQDVDAWDYLHPEGSVAFTSSPSFSRPPRMLPVTAAATLALMDHHGVGDVAGKRVVVVGRGPLVGAPIAHSLTERGATVSVAHSRTPRKVLQELCESADVLVPCVGMPGVIDGAWIKEGAVVVNVGTSFDADNDALLGDVSGVDANISADGAPASGVLAKASKVAACPGGVGPVVVAQLFDAVVARSERVQEREARGATASTPVLPENEVLERMAELNAGIEASSVRWTLTSAEQDESIPALTRSLHFGSYSQAAVRIESSTRVKSRLPRSCSSRRWCVAATKLFYSQSKNSVSSPASSPRQTRWTTTPTRVSRTTAAVAWTFSSSSSPWQSEA